MLRIERVELILEAIKSVKERIKLAAKEGNLQIYKQLAEDLVALECTLVPETEALVLEIKKIA